MMAGTGLHVVWMAAVVMSSGIAQRVDMNNASLSSIPAGKPANLTQLILSHNSVAMSASDIKTLQEYPRIRELDLSYNHIQALPAGAFDSLADLETLKLTGNQLQTLDKNTFKALTKLRSLELEENPWNCSCSLMSLIKQLKESGVSTGSEVMCYSSEKTAVLDGNPFCLNQSTTVETILAATPEPSNSSSSKGLAGGDGGTPAGSHSWKFLLGVVALTLSTSMLIVCAVKSPSWYKLLFNYRHQRLREDVEPSVFNTGRFSNFSLDTEQTETSAQELDQDPFEDDDGFIEDGYIDPENYSQPSDAPNGPLDAPNGP
ncbi:leucine-rich repeat-containing protein 19-like [Pseudorasbora parva]|uniref:leucine-rich repeat-containing protein 19-like n=1 Tax=Pseudorasbora parva TaxID=51549 RepID=UPI00351F28FA